MAKGIRGTYIIAFKDAQLLLCSLHSWKSRDGIETHLLYTCKKMYNSFNVLQVSTSSIEDQLQADAFLFQQG